MAFRMRYVCCTLLAVFALLFMGAGKLGGDSFSRSETAEKARLESCEAILNLRSGVPESGRDSWTRLAAEHPEIFLRATTRISGTR